MSSTEIRIYLSKEKKRVEYWSCTWKEILNKVNTMLIVWLYILSTLPRFLGWNALSIWNYDLNYFPGMKISVLMRAAYFRFSDTLFWLSQKKKQKKKKKNTKNQ